MPPSYRQQRQELAGGEFRLVPATGLEPVTKGLRGRVWRVRERSLMAVSYSTSAIAPDSMAADDRGYAPPLMSKLMSN